MSYYISEIAKEAGIDPSIFQVQNEKRFNVFTRVTSIINDEACIYITDNKYIKNVFRQDMVKMIITTSDISGLFHQTNKGICITDNPKVLYSVLLDYINRRHDENNTVATTIGNGCEISKSAHVFDHDVILGENVVVEDYAIIYPHTRIGDGSIIHANAIIGGQDYNYYYENGVPKHIYHGGSVVIGKNVEIGCNTGIGRALFIENATQIGDNCKISSNCGIGHDSWVGERVMIYSGSVLGGNVTIEDDVHITLNCTIKNGLKIGKGALICMGSNVLTNVKEGNKVFGNPAKKMDL